MEAMERIKNAEKDSLTRIKAAEREAERRIMDAKTKAEASLLREKEALKDMEQEALLRAEREALAARTDALFQANEEAKRIYDYATAKMTDAADLITKTILEE